MLEPRRGPRREPRLRDGAARGDRGGDARPLAPSGPPPKNRAKARDREAPLSASAVPRMHRSAETPPPPQATSPRSEPPRPDRVAVRPKAPPPSAPPKPPAHAKWIPLDRPPPLKSGPRPSRGPAQASARRRRPPEDPVGRFVSWSVSILTLVGVGAFCTLAFGPMFKTLQAQNWEMRLTAKSYEMLMVPIYAAIGDDGSRATPHPGPADTPSPGGPAGAAPSSSDATLLDTARRTAAARDPGTGSVLSLAETPLGVTGSLSTMTREIEIALASLWFAPGVIDGTYDDDLAEAIGRYQLISGLPVTRRPSPDLLRDLRRTVAEARRTAEALRERGIPAGQALPPGGLGAE